jgi:hypothetical protein
VLWGLDGGVSDGEEAWVLFIGSLRRFGRRKIGGGASPAKALLGAGPWWPARISALNGVVGQRDGSGRRWDNSGGRRDSSGSRHGGGGDLGGARLAAVWR